MKTNTYNIHIYLSILIFIILFLFLISTALSKGRFFHDPFAFTLQGDEWRRRNCRIVSSSTSEYLAVDENGIVVLNNIQTDEGIWIYLYNSLDTSYSMFYNISSRGYLIYEEYIEDSPLKVSSSKMQLYILESNENNSYVSIRPSSNDNNLDNLYVTVKDDMCTLQLYDQIKSEFLLKNI